MIQELKKTFEYLPKFDNEEDRKISVESYSMGYEYRLVIYINGIRHTASYIVSDYELREVFAFGEDVILRSLCKKFSNISSDPTKYA